MFTGVALGFGEGVGAHDGVKVRRVSAFKVSWESRGRVSWFMRYLPLGFLGPAGEDVGIHAASSFRGFCRGSPGERVRVHRQATCRTN